MAKTKSKMEVMEAPPKAKVTRIEGRAELVGMPSEPLNLVGLRARVSMMSPNTVGDDFRRLIEAGLVENPRACYNELKRLGYSAELNRANISFTESK
jgi:hypothetical protein